MTVRVRMRLRDAKAAVVSEHTEAVRFMAAVRANEAAYPSLVWLHHIPNGGWRRKAVAGKLKAEGVRRGIHDYFWPVRMPIEAGSDEVYSGLYIELKSGDGTASKEQKEFAAFVRGQGFKAVFARGWEEAWKAVCDYAGIPYRVI